VICLQGEQNIQDAMALMTERHIRHLPVLEDDQVIGIITIGDVVKDVISTQEFVIEQLEHYISGDR
jgi:CBS domain-containing protein